MKRKTFSVIVIVSSACLISFSILNLLGIKLFGEYTSTVNLVGAFLMSALCGFIFRDLVLLMKVKVAHDEMIAEFKEKTKKDTADMDSKELTESLNMINNHKGRMQIINLFLTKI